MPAPGHRPKIPAGPSRHVYDVIVLGSQLGGALAAALLSKRGHRVLFIEHDGLGPGYEHHGYLLPYAPFVAQSLRTMLAVEDAFTELGLTTTVQRTMRPHVPELQLVMPRRRVDLVMDTTRKTAELTREFGEAGHSILAALTAAASQHEATDPFFRGNPPLPPDGLFETLALKRQIRQHRAVEAAPPLPAEGEPFQLLQGFVSFISHLHAPASPLARARPLSQVLRAPLRFPGGRDGLRELLCKRLSELGGDLLSRDTSDSFVVEELSFERGRFSAVKLVGSENLYRARCLVSATDSGALRRLIADKKRQRALIEQLDLSTVREFLFAVNWVLPAAALPRGLGELALVDTQDPVLGPLLLQVHPVRHAHGKEKDDEGLRVVCAGCFVAASARERGEDHLQQLAARVDQQLDQLLPFARDHRVLRSAPYLDAGGVRGSRLLPHPLYSFDAEVFLGVAGLRQRTPVSNVLLAGREVLPGLGLEGELLAGMRAARMVHQMFKKTDPLK